MRPLTLLAVAAFATTGCVDKIDESRLPADTAHVAPQPAGMTAADLAGTWDLNVMPVDRDSVLVTYKLIATAENAGWKVVFPNRNDTVAVSAVAVDGDSVVTKFGPYSSALRPGVQVVAETVGRVANGRMAGTITARYSVQTADSVVHLRFGGTRAP